MTLSDWLSAHSMSDAALADKLGVHRSTVGRWIAGTMMPERVQLARIMQVTEGEVTANDFVGVGRSRPKSAA